MNLIFNINLYLKKYFLVLFLVLVACVGDNKLDDKNIDKEKESP